MVMEADESLAELIQRSNRILIFTGAGVSTGSGIPDFRGPNGIWQHRKPVYYEEFMSSEAARIEHWDYKLETWPAFRDARPNSAHKAIVKLLEAGKLLMVVTQNVDGLHRRAGTPADKLVEIHGTNGLVECQSCHRQSDPDPHFEHFRQTRQPPICDCGGLLKPATISFGQSLRGDDLNRAQDAAAKADLVLALGSSLSVYPASQIPLLALRSGAAYAIINQGPTDHDGAPGVRLRIEGNVNEVFPPAVSAALGRSKTSCARDSFSPSK